MNGKNCISVVLLSSTLAACGGGGGTSGASVGIASTGGLLSARGDGGGGLNHYNEAPGSTTQTAQLTGVNHESFIKLLLFSVYESDTKGDGYVWRDISGVDTSIMDTENPHPSLMPDEIRNEVVTLLEQYIAAKRNTTQARSVNSGTIACPYGGHMVLSGDLDDSTNTGLLNINYSDCLTDIYLKNGHATLSLNKLEPTQGIMLDYAIGYNDLSVDTKWNGFVYKGSQHVNNTVTNNRTTKTVVASNLSRTDQKAGDAVSVDLTVNTRDRTAQSINGQLCNGSFGCVEVSTRIGFSTRLRQGELSMTGLGGSNIRLYYSGGRLHTQIDGNGNGNYGEPFLVTL